MSDPSQLPAGVPHLLDQYKQRRQAWLDQADELARLRDEVRLAAEREALDIVTAARRDVRRIVVEARRELLVLTAQLHTAIESVDQASLQSGDPASADHTSLTTHGGVPGSADSFGTESLGATRDAVLGARREVRSVLDEARAEIEALAAESRTPPPEAPAALAIAFPASHSIAASHAEPPIPTLETILGSDPSTPRGFVPMATLSYEAAPAAGPNQAGATAEVASLSSQPQRLDHERQFLAPGPEQPVSFVLAPDADTLLGGFHKRDPEEKIDYLTSTPGTFGETGPTPAPESSTAFLGDYDRGARSKPMWPWVGMFAATGILLLAGAAWWAQAREARSTLLASIAATSPTVPPSTGEQPAAESATTAGPEAAAVPSPTGLAIEVRRTSWIRAVVDGKEDSRVYQAGETRNIVGARTVSLRAGDGGGVFVSVDGRPAEALGVAGTAVTRQYSLAGPAVVPAVATAAAPSPTPAANTPAQDARTTAPASGSVDAARIQAPPARPSEAAAAPATSQLAPTPAAPAGDGSTAAPASGGRADLVSAGQQWLDAYQRRDRDGMAATGTDNVSVSDERTLTERFPAWQVGIRRDLDQVELELTGDTALLTARMTERSGDNGTTSAQHVSRVSQIWVRRNGRWRVADVRIMGEGRLNQIVR